MSAVRPPASSEPPTPDEIATALREDPVLVDPRFGNGDTDAVHDGLADLAAQGEHPVYVVLVEQPEGLADSDPAADLASRLHAASGEPDATYLVHLGAQSHGHEVVGFGDAPGASELFERQPGAAFDGGSNAGLTPAGVLARDLDVLVGDQLDDGDYTAYAETQPWAETDVWEAGADVPDAADALFAPTFLAVALAGVAGVVVDQAIRWRRAPAVPRATWLPSTPERPERPERPRSRAGDDLRDAGASTVAVRLDRELDALVEAVARVTGDDDTAPSERRERRDGSLDTARLLRSRLPDEPGDDDLADLLGALVLVRTAARELEATSRHGRRGGPARRSPYRSCALDPRHGEASTDRRLPVGDREVALPLCAVCARTPAASLRPLEVPGVGWRRRARPYLEAESVWAATGFGAFVDELWPHVADDLRSRR